MYVRVTIEAPCSELSKVLKALIESHGQMTRAEAASLVCLSAGQFSRQFKRATGLCFREIQVALRMRRAGALLTNTDMPIRAVAELLGYSELGKFQKAFRRFYGRTPTVHRLQGNQRLKSA